MYKIGEFSVRSGLSVKTLRFYDEIGLLKPAATDGSSRYRFYSEREVARAAEILALKRLGYSLEEISRVLDDRLDPRAVLEEARRRLERSIEAQRRELAEVEARLAALAADPFERIRLERRPALVVASVRDRVDTYAEADELFRELERDVRADARGAARGTLWHSCRESGSGLEAEVFVEVRAGARGRGRTRVEELPAVALAACAGASDDDWPDVYRALELWISENDFALARPKRELFTTDPFTGATRIDVVFPVVEH